MMPEPVRETKKSKGDDPFKKQPIFKVTIQKNSWENLETALKVAKGAGNTRVVFKLRRNKNSSGIFMNCLSDTSLITYSKCILPMPIEALNLESGEPSTSQTVAFKLGPLLQILQAHPDAKIVTLECRDMDKIDYTIRKSSKKSSSKGNFRLLEMGDARDVDFRKIKFQAHLNFTASELRNSISAADTNGAEDVDFEVKTKNVQGGKLIKSLFIVTYKTDMVENKQTFPSTCSPDDTGALVMIPNDSNEDDDDDDDIASEYTSVTKCSFNTKILLGIVKSLPNAAVTLQMGDNCPLIITLNMGEDGVVMTAVSPNVTDDE